MFVLAYTKFSCGGLNDLAAPIANLISTVINSIKLITPVILIVFGLFDMFKATTSQKEDEMKKSQQLFVKRIISAVLVFFVVAVVQLSFKVLADASGDGSFMECITCFVNGVDGTGVCK